MLAVQGLTKSYVGRVLFEDAAFVVAPGERVGVVGRNGSGKTTLLRILLGEETSDSGTVTTPKGYTFGHLSQHLDFAAPTVLDEACTALRPNEDGWVETYRAETVLSGLGVDPEAWGRPPSELSGGFQVRLNLAKVLLAGPDMLLLDEPTNYLDITSTRWLESFLTSWRGEVMIVTHDRAFLDTVSTHVLGIHRRRLRKLKGTTDRYYDTIAAEEETYAATLANADKAREHLEAFVRRFRAKATKARQAQSRVKMLERLGPAEKLADLDALDFVFTPAPFPGKTMLTAEGVTFGYEAGRPLIEDLDLAIGARDRIAVIGPNGRGKTTLLEILAGGLETSGGKVSRSPNLRLGYFGQTNVNRLRVEATVEEEILDALEQPTRGRARSLAGRMMFEGDDALKKVGVLSGGERARVLLAQILARPANLLLLDEPTNHLDMDSVSALADAVAVFPGAVVLVAHDEDLLHAVAERLVVFDGGTVAVFEGGYGDFLRQVGWVEERGDRASGPAPTGPRGAKAAGRKDQRRARAAPAAARSRPLGPLTPKITATEAAIADLEHREAETTLALTAAAEAGESVDVGRLAHDLHDVQTERDRLYEVLVAASEEYEARRAELDATDAAAGPTPS